MDRQHRLAFLGFSEFERGALSSYFRLAASRTPHYVLVHMLTDADFLVADADHAASVQLVAATERLADTVFIGSQAPAGCTAWMPRPIDALHVMRELDAMVALAHAGARVADERSACTDLRAGGAVTAAVPKQAPAGATTGADITLDMRLNFSTAEGEPNGAAGAAPEELPAPDIFVPNPSAILLEPAFARFTPALPVPRSGSTAQDERAPGSTPQPPAPAPAPAAPLPRALLVDDSEIALRYLQTRLQRWGLQIDLAGSSGAAIERLAAHSYDLVFLDVELGAGSELGGLELCRHIKQSAAAVSASVVMVSAHHSELDRVRGALAGCDAYLAKPLQEAELERLLQRHGLKADAAAV